jgi:hypothetical protein
MVHGCEAVPTKATRFWFRVLSVAVFAAGIFDPRPEFNWPRGCEKPFT